MKKMFFFTFLVEMFFLTACGDDVTQVETVTLPSGVSQVETQDELVSCDEKSSGRLFYVSEKNEIYYCSGEKWLALSTKDDFTEKTSAVVVASEEEMPTCNQETEGSLVYVETSAIPYFCGNSGKWLSIKGADGLPGVAGKSCSVAVIENGYKVLCDGDSVGVLLNGTAGSEGKSCSIATSKTGYDVLCGNEIVGSLRNGSDGADGDPGDPGNDGTSCGVAAIENGFKIICGKDSVGVFYNGEKGEKGNPGATGNDGESCSVKAVDKGYEVYCGETYKGMLLNGSEGEKGDQGETGANGESCGLVKATNGYLVLCGEKVVGSLSNGLKGEKGDSGLDGKDCTLKDNGNGTVTQTCNDKSVLIYKALCGTLPYDPAGNKFCFDLELFDKCNGEIYDPSAYFCAGNVKTPKCGTKSYDVESQFCVKSQLYDFCAGGDYDVGKFYCEENGLKPYKCGEQTYDVTTHICDTRDNRLYKYVSIKGVRWTAENLNFDYNEVGAESYCYDDDEVNCDSYGRLYTWPAARHACPEGWRLPYVSEFNELVDLAGGKTSVLRDQSWSNGENTFGFSVLPVGARNYTGKYALAGERTNFWTYSSGYCGGSRGYNAQCAYDLYFDESLMKIYTYYQDVAFSVRCVKER